MVKKMTKEMYVTFRVPKIGLYVSGYFYYAVKCYCVEDLSEIAEDLSEIQDTKYVKINKSGKLSKQHNFNILNRSEYYQYKWLKRYN